MSLNKVIEIARGELGVTESPPGSNRVKYWDLFGPEWQGQPWCCAFLAWVFNTAGERMAFFGGGKTASCSMLLRWYREQGLTVPVEDVQVGDIVLLNFNGKGTPDHCGLVNATGVTTIDKSSANAGDWLKYGILTIEGNTSPSDGSQSNGGMVCEKTRYPSQIVGVCRPQYQPEVVDDITGHWAEKEIRWCMDKGLMKGYPDGSFRPDKPVTRAELAAVLARLPAIVSEK